MIMIDYYSFPRILGFYIIYCKEQPIYLFEKTPTKQVMKCTETQGLCFNYYNSLIDWTLFILKLLLNKFYNLS